MTDVALAQPAPQTTTEYEAEFERLMAEASHLDKLMGNDRIEIERLKAETQAIAKDTARMKNETRAMLTSMGVKL